MPENLTKEIRFRTRDGLRLSSIGATELAIALGVAYFIAAYLSLKLLAKPDGVAVFWLSAGLSSGVLIALGRDARLPVAGDVIVATIVANLTAGRSIWNAAASALWNTGEALLTAWLIERYFDSGFNLGRLRNMLGLLAAAVATSSEI